MKRLIWVCGLIALFVIAVMSRGLGQYEEDRPSKFSMDVGLYRPSGPKLRAQGSSAWKTFGVGYNLKLDDTGRPEACVTLQHASSEKGRFEGGLTGISYMRLWHGKGSEVRGPYFGVGTGFYALKEKLETSYFPFEEGEEHSGTKIGFSLAGGYNFSENWFAELRYVKVGELATDVDFSGFSLRFGAKLAF